jgi:hypothetical protein
MRRASLLLVLASLLGVPALAGPATASFSSTARRAEPTATVVVRPVTAAGAPAPGYRVRRVRHVFVSCAGPALAAVDAGIVECFPTAAYLPSCWKSVRHTVLCLRDPRRHVLLRVRYAGGLHPEPALAVPAPQLLVLGSGPACSIRIGGAWGTVPGHPRWVGYYACDRGTIWGPADDRRGVDRSEPTWMVHWANRRLRLADRAVRTAYLVGTAA